MQGRLTVNITPTAKPSITADTLVQAVVDHYPRTIAVFTHYGLDCVGCYIAPFHTVADSAREYGLALEPLLREFNAVIIAETEEHAR